VPVMCGDDVIMFEQHCAMMFLPLSDLVDTIAYRPTVSRY